MKNTPKIISIFQVLLIFLFVQQVHGGTYLHRATGIEFPDKIAGLENVKVTDYEDRYPGLGIGVSYRHSGIKADIYLYKGRFPQIPQGINSPLITHHFEQVVGDIYNYEKKGAYQSVKKLSEGKISLGHQSALSASFSYFEKDIERLSYIYLTGYDNHFLKIRFTYYQSVKTDGKASLSDFLKTIGELMVKSKDQ